MHSCLNFHYKRQLHFKTDSTLADKQMKERIFKITDKDHSLGNNILDSHRVLGRNIRKLIIVGKKKILGHINPYIFLPTSSKPESNP